MKPLFFVDRQTKKIEEEQVYFGEIIKFLYGNTLVSKLFGHPITYLISRLPCFSALFGWWNHQSWTRSKILPFIEKYQLNIDEFEKKPSEFLSFNDFFVRKLKKEARPIDSNLKSAVIPADGRYLFFPNIKQSDGFFVKGEKFSLSTLLNNKALADEYEEGTMVIARLCPTDYHRYHFPIDNTPEETTLINGYLYSVNPVAVKQDITIFTKNKRSICLLKSEKFDNVLFIEVGATNVGSINQTYKPGKKYKKGEEKGYFSFGASTLILLFKPDIIELEADLLEGYDSKIEIRCLMGQKMGTRKAPI